MVNAQGCNEGCWLLRRLPHRLHAVANAATKVAGCYEGCHKVCRLLQRLNVAVKAVTKVVGCYGGCHIGYKLLRRLPHRLQVVEKAATKLAGSCRGCYEGCHTAKKAVTKAATWVEGCCEGCHKVCKLLQRLNDAVKVATEYGNPLREGPKPFTVRLSTKLGQRRETTPPPGFSTPPHIPNINTTERPPVTTTVFATTTPGNTPFAYRASTLTDPAPMISPAFIRSEDLQTELEYFSEDYDEELEMEPRPEQTRDVTPPLRTRSPRVRRQRERVVGFEEAPNRERSIIGRNIEGNGPSEARAEENRRWEMNFPSLLAAHLGRNECGQPP
ncbi:hypothetical protein Tco_0855571 [Tanacetum coccineum]